MTDADPINPADIRLAAMNLLARREHSFVELEQKLRKRFSDREAIVSELQRLADENLQSDERYAESFCRQRAQKGYGPLRVRQEMREKGLSDQAISAAFESAELDWYAIAEAAYLKKFGDRPGEDIKEKARRIRFMQYRGFHSEQYQGLVDA